MHFRFECNSTNEKLKILSLTDSFQKGSPILEDFNNLVFLAGQMGYTWATLGSNLMEMADVYDNYTRCDSWEKIASSHKVAENKRVVKIEDTYGLLILLFAGFSIATIAIVAEKLISAKANMPREGHEVRQNE